MKSESDKKPDPEDNVSPSSDETAGESGNDPQHDKPTGKGWGERLVGLLPVIGELIVCGVVAGILDKAADFASSHNFEKIASGLKFLSLVSLLALIPLIVIKVVDKKVLVWGGFAGMVMLLGLSLLWFEKYFTPDHPEPRFELYVSVLRANGTNTIPLTNTSLVLRIPANVPGVVESLYTTGFVFVPVPNASSPVGLTFHVAGSPLAVDVKGLSFKLSYRETFRVVPELPEKWVRGEIAISGTKSIGIRDTGTIFSNNVLIMPSVFLHPPSPWVADEGFCPIFVSMRADNIPDTLIGFELMCSPSLTNLFTNSVMMLEDELRQEMERNPARWRLPKTN